MPRYHGRDVSLGLKVSRAEIDHYERALYAEHFKGSMASWIRRILNKEAINILTLDNEDVYINNRTWEPVPSPGRPRKSQVKMKVDGSPLEDNPRAYRKQRVIDLDRD